MCLGKVGGRAARFIISRSLLPPPPLKKGVTSQPRTDFSNGLLSLMQTCRRELTDKSRHLLCATPSFRRFCKCRGRTHPPFQLTTYAQRYNLLPRFLLILILKKMDY